MFTSKYSDKFKLKIVEEYLNGTLGYNLLARKYSIPSRSVIQTWVNQYQINGEEGLQAQKTNNKSFFTF
ncbi:MAG: transposase [Tissierella sp.]|uniref:transposase n=1 Tax=Tissierella sp. TaxID=41274 RepID=UPI003F9BFC24